MIDTPKEIYEIWKDCKNHGMEVPEHMSLYYPDQMRMLFPMIGAGGCGATNHCSMPTEYFSHLLCGIIEDWLLTKGYLQIHLPIKDCEWEGGRKWFIECGNEEGYSSSEDTRLKTAYNLAKTFWRTEKSSVQEEHSSISEEEKKYWENKDEEERENHYQMMAEQEESYRKENPDVVI